MWMVLGTNLPLLQVLRLSSETIGNFIAGSSTPRKASSVIEAKAFALVDGVQLAIQLNYDTDLGN